jgi:hypothetical protein
VPLPTFTSLQILTAANLTELVTWFPTHAFKLTDGTPFPSTTAMANDEDLILALVANYSYTFNAMVVYGAGTTADIKLGWTFPTGATLTYAALGTDVTAGGNAPVETVSVAEASDTSKPYGGAGISSFRFVEYTGRITVSSTAGNLTLRRAQNTSTAENTLIKAGSFLTLQRVA